MTNLWSSNEPSKFWLPMPLIEDRFWQEAIRKSVPLLDFTDNKTSQNELVELTLGEGRFGPHHWNLSFAKRLYYLIKPYLPRQLTRLMRKYYSVPASRKSQINWPIDSRYAMFQWEVMRQLLIATGNRTISYRSFWPEGHQFALVLTHDIETADGQAFVRDVANMEEGLGFRSSFNFVMEKYPLDMKLIEELRDRGFEVGCHGLKHDGKLFNSRSTFDRKAAKINAYLQEFKIAGFRSPLTHRNPKWMQTLNVEYDLSFFDTDPFEPIPGGTLCIWPYFLGNFVELPYTLVQDYTLTAVLGETTPRIWLEKVDFIRKYNGMALLNTHPDYLRDDNTLDIYLDFLRSMKDGSGYWHTLPRRVANWWKTRSQLQELDKEHAYTGTISLDKSGRLFVD